MWSFDRNPVLLLRLNIRHFGQRGLELLPTATLGALPRIVDRHQGSHLLGNGRIHKLIDRYAFLSGKLAQLLMKRVGQS